mgnify:CR=1 FL=1|jgi:hypothetical protein|tara:strand:- start:51 stop:431 length:381 start_codon:yes stop_codon:yes gene_type:complete
MASSIKHGYLGSVSWASDAQADTYVTAWTLEITCDVAESTSLNDYAAAGTSWKAFVAGPNDWTATVDVNMMSCDPVKLGLAEATLALSDGTTSYDCPAICVGVSNVMSVDDIYKCTFSFAGSGAPV